MTIYYYAHSGHKYGLDSVRRGVALIKSLRQRGMEMQLLVNDFRAGLAAKDLGVGDAVTIETILDVDAVAVRGDWVVLDTPEDIVVRMEKYCELFDKVLYVTDDCEYQSHYGEIVLKPSCSEKDDAHCLDAALIDPEYFEILPKEERVLFFFGDSDHGKELLANKELFQGLDMELLLGHYFFVKYEDDLEKIFGTLHEPEEYADLIRTSSTVLTASAQCALEARSSEAETLYLKRKNDTPCLLAQLESFGIKIIDGINNNKLKELMAEGRKSTKRVPNRLSSLVNILQSS